MTNFTCPSTGIRVLVEPGRLLSTHTTATGRVAYARCACDGLAVLDAGRATGWAVIGHGRRGAGARTTARCA